MIQDEKLICLGTGKEFADDGLLLENPSSPAPALLRTVYSSKKLTLQDGQPGIFRFSDWLPARKVLRGGGAPVTYHSEALGSELGLARLYISFNGYWPERGAEMRSGTFKECEAYSVCARLPDKAGNLVVASAGNTARAFLQAACENGIPIVIVVPEGNLGSLWSQAEPAPCVRVVAAGGDSDYYDAIRLAGDICAIEGFVNEGGAKNVGRRDGMGVTVLSAVTFIGEIPDYYFQAVGSGTGAIAAHEANLRLNSSGDYRPKLMKLMLSQNIPFTPMAKAWAHHSRTLPPQKPEEAARQIGQMDAKVLSNRQPPYGMIGGLYDALSAAGGDIDAIGNDMVREATALFEKLEGRDICPEAGVALASLILRARRGDIGQDAIVMLNITGGGMKPLMESKRIFRPEPRLIVGKGDIGAPETREKLRML